MLNEKKSNLTKKSAFRFNPIAIRIQHVNRQATPETNNTKMTQDQNKFEKEGQQRNPNKKTNFKKNISAFFPHLLLQTSNLKS